MFLALKFAALKASFARLAISFLAGAEWAHTHRVASAFRQQGH